MNHVLLDAAMMSMQSFRPGAKTTATVPTKVKQHSNYNSKAEALHKGLDESMQSINATLNTFNSSRKTTNPTYLKSMKRRRRGVRSQEDSVASELSDHRSVDNSESTFRVANSSNAQRFNYGGVNIGGTVGTLTLVAGERLLFKPRDPRDKDNVYSWPLEAILKHQISARNSGSCLLRLISQANPSKAVNMTFPDRTSLENINSYLSSQLQPLRKYRRLKETLLATQRKLKEANRFIDEMHETNETLLASCDALGRKCKSLSQELQLQRQKKEQHLINDSTRVAELEEQLNTLQPEMEALLNEKTAMAICHEMDNSSYTARIAALEKELAEEREALELERSTTQKLLEDRELVDGLQMEIELQQKDLSRERQRVKELQFKLQQRITAPTAPARTETKESLLLLRKQRNAAVEELAAVKKERDNLLRRLKECQNRQESLEEEEDDAVDSIQATDHESGGPVDGAGDCPDLTWNGCSVNRCYLALTSVDWMLGLDLPVLSYDCSYSSFARPHGFPYCDSLTPWGPWVVEANTSRLLVRGAGSCLMPLGDPYFANASGEASAADPTMVAELVDEASPLAIWTNTNPAAGSVPFAEGRIVQWPTLLHHPPRWSQPLKPASPGVLFALPAGRIGLPKYSYALSAETVVKWSADLSDRIQFQ